MQEQAKDLRGWAIAVSVAKLMAGSGEQVSAKEQPFPYLGEEDQEMTEEETMAWAKDLARRTGGEVDDT